MMFANLQGRVVPMDEKNSCKKHSRNEADLKHDGFLREWVLREEKRKRGIVNGVD
jgi:hypothetical protein